MIASAPVPAEWCRRRMIQAERLQRIHIAVRQAPGGDKIVGAFAGGAEARLDARQRREDSVERSAI